MRANLGALFLLFLVDFVTAAMLVLVMSQPTEPVVVYLRIVFALLLVLVLPGYAIFKALLPGEYDSITQAVYSVGLSPAIALMGGVVLHGTVGLSTNNWIFLLSGFTLIVSLFAFVRVVLHQPLIPEPDISAPSEIHWRQIVTFGMGIAVAAVALNMAHTSAVAQDEQIHFTQLWTYKDKASGMIKIGLHNAEGKLMSYRVMAFDDDITLLGRWTPTVEPDATWELRLSIPPTIDTNTLRVLLYREDHPHELYRHTKLWLRQPLLDDTPKRRY